MRLLSILDASQGLRRPSRLALQVLALLETCRRRMLHRHDIMHLLRRLQVSGKRLHMILSVLLRVTVGTMTCGSPAGSVRRFFFATAASSRLEL